MGTPIGDADTGIAAIALANGLVVTGNVRRFGRVAGLTIENWMAPEGDADDTAWTTWRGTRSWDAQASQWVESGERAWAQAEPTWGIWEIPESELRVLPDVSGRDVIELGCGTAYISAWLARRGARVVGIDNSERQLETARQLQERHQLTFELIHGNAEEVRAG